MTTCETCGAAVADSIRHAGWHAELLLWRRAVASSLAALAYDGEDAKLRANQVDKANEEFIAARGRGDRY
jgi:hypothetical protein